MRRRTASGLAAALLVAGAVATPAVAEPSAAPASSSTASPSSRTVELITGDRVSVTTGVAGRPAVALAPDSAGPTHNFQVLASGSHLYVIPEVAAGYVGQPLDLSLFDVAALPDAGSSQPLSMTYTATGTPSIAGTAPDGPGRLVLRDPAALGRALADDRTAADRGAPHSDPFDGITRLALAGAAPTSAPTTPGALYTLTVRAFDRNGRPVTGDLGTVMNADNVDTFLAAQGYYRGSFAFSVPAGTYSIASYIGTGHRDGSIDYTLAAAPEVHVSHDTTVVLDARLGTVLSATVDQPTQQVSAQLNLQRNPATGLSFTDSFLTFGDTALYATPTRQVHTGQLYFYPGLRLGGPDGSVQDDLYDMELPYVGAIPSTLQQTIGADQLATIDATYHSAIPGRAEYETREGAMPWQAVQVFGANELAAPDKRTERVLVEPDMRWLQYVVLDLPDFLGMMGDIVRSYAAGEHTTSDWAAQPAAPGVQQDLDGVQDCPACRSGDALGLELFAGTDAQGHLLLPDSSSTESLTLYQDGTEVGQAPAGFASFPVSTDPASYRLVFDSTRQADWWPASTAQSTTWTFTSAAAPADQLPAGWTCGGKGGGGGGGKGGSVTVAGAAGGCSFLPLLFPRYRTGAGADDVLPAGHPASVEVDVAHQFGAAASPIASFAAQVSFDGGASWTDVAATKLADGRYRLDYPQPVLEATDGFASLHIVAADGAGSGVDQTITDAYPLAVPAGPAGAEGQPGSSDVRACSTATAAPYAQCMSVIDAAGTGSAPDGYGPADIQAAYNVPDGGQGRTVAIVDAYDDPNAESDLAAYRAQYGLPACTTANGCFRKVNEHGAAGPLPDPSPGWGLEISLDLDAVSATCPACHILLVEADSSNTPNLLTGVLAADALHADAISNSYGTRGEFSGEQLAERYLRRVSAPALYATGDYGYGNGAILIGGISYPAASRYAVAVGGTSLRRDDTSARGWSEQAWDGATSGCSAYIHKPAWQHDSLCGMRTVADISAVADPATGLAVYDTFGYNGWLHVGGTSLATPVVSSLYAMRGGPADLDTLYRDPSAVFDVVGGANGTNCSDTYLCTAVPGYDGPTGLGSPDAGDAYWHSG